MGLWKDEEIKRALSLKVREVTTEAGEMLYEYNNVGSTDLIYLREGMLTSGLELDHSFYFTHTLQDYYFLGLFAFTTGLAIPNIRAICNNYCNIFLVSRQDYKEILSIPHRI